MLLLRYDSNHERIFGRLYLPNGVVLQTLEKPWQQNKPFVSCVPEGDYDLEYHMGTKYEDTWALVGDTVGHWPSNDKPRSTCVFHAGNVVSETTGCILVGTTREDETLVSSVFAMGKLRDALHLTEPLPSLRIVSATEGALITPDKGAKEMLGSVFGDKSWYKSLTAWGSIVFLFGQQVFDTLYQTGAIGADVFDKGEQWIGQIGAVMVALGLRRASVSARPKE